MRGGYGVGVWKTIRNEQEGIRSGSRNGRRVKFGKDLCCEDQTLKEVFLNIFLLIVNKDS